jgi:hypothetical protein
MVTADLSADQQVDALKADLERDQTALMRLEQEVDSAGRSLDKYSGSSVDAYNRKVDRYNSARDAVNFKIDQYNRMVEANNASGLVTHTNVSIGGGIQLSLRNAKIVRRAPHAPQVKAIAAARPHFVDSGNVQVGGGWVRSRP